LGCNIIQKKTENKIKLDSAIGLDGVLSVSVTNFPLSSIEELFKNKIMGISRPVKSLGTNGGRTTERVSRGEYKSNDYGIFKNSENIRGGTDYWNGADEWICHGDYNYKYYEITLQYNRQKEINGEVKLVVENEWVVVPTKLKDEIDKEISDFIADIQDTD